MTLAPVAHPLPAGRTPSRLQPTTRAQEVQRYIDIGRRRAAANPLRPKVRVMIADAKTMVRGALVALLGTEPDIDVVAEVDGTANIVADALRIRPDVVVLDLALTKGDNLGTAKALRTQLPTCQVMILANIAQPKALRSAIEAEVRGFVVTDAPPGLFAESIRRLAAGEFVIDSSLASKALASSDCPLTHRQREVLEAAAEGASVNEIAARLSLSEGTVRNYLSATIAKLGARNRVDAIRIAQIAGWI